MNSGKRIGLFGFGNVGGGVGEILWKEKESSTSGLDIVKICVKNIDTTYRLGIPLEYFTEEKNDILENPEIDIVVELIGGTSIAKEIVEKALQNKKHVVTANKALLAEYGNELFALAKQNGVHLKFEASVGGGIPIIRTLQTHYFVGDITKVSGIVNGTCNFILSEIESKGSEYADILKEAQKNGFAEADPTFDVEGYDAAQKLAILSHLAFGIHIPDWKKISVSGISQLHSADFAFAKQMDKKIRLVVSAEKNKNTQEIFLSVSPTMVSSSGVLGTVYGPMNIITIDHEYLGSIAMRGAGAGRYPTAVSVISDIFSIVRDESFSASQQETESAITQEPVELRSFYFRFFVKDEPGVLAKVSEVFGKNNVSISEVKNAHGNEVPLSILTHPISFAQKNMLTQDLSTLSVVLGNVISLEVQ